MESDECKKEADECLDIYNKVFRGEKLTAKEFTRFGTWAKFSTCIEDKNRQQTCSLFFHKYGVQNENSKIFSTSNGE